jgi:hypothetical protein
VIPNIYPQVTCNGRDIAPQFPHHQCILSHADKDREG